MEVDLKRMLLPVKVGPLTFRNPFYVGSGPTTKSIKHLVKADQMGWAAASIKLTFDPAPYVSLEPRYAWWDEQGLVTFSAESRLTVEEGLRLMEEGRKKTRPDFLLMANITYIGDKPGVTGWVDMAKRFESVGADIIELNMCCPNMSYNVSVSGSKTMHQTGASLGGNAEALSHIVREVARGVKIPVFVKLTPEGGRIGQVAKAAHAAGAAAVGTAANRLGVPMMDIYNPQGPMYHLQDEPSMSCLSGPWIRPLSLRDVFEMRREAGPELTITGSGGFMTLNDAVMAAMCGADLICICSGVLLKGFELLPPLVAELKAYLKKMNYREFRDMRDILVKRVTPATKLTIRKGYARKKSDVLRGPCQVACPFHVPAQDYVTLVADGDFNGAFKMITGRNPLQSICGWVCNHPCENACTRAELDEPIRIRDIKRFVLEKGAKEGWKPEVSRAAPRKEQAAVVGSGPAGLSAAWHLARAGYKVTVFEAAERFGGMLRYAIPRFRLPESVLDAEIKSCADLGIKFVAGKALGEDFTLSDLKAQGFKAVVLAVGASAALPLGVPGEEGAGCMSALDFLDDAATGGKVKIGKRVAIVGGGFTAVDSARTAIRLGAKEVYVLYRRTRAEMPATSDEVDEAEAEGVRIMYLVSPREVIREKGKVKALRMVNYVLGERDGGGRRAPREVEGTEFTLQVDAVISAVSQGLPEGAKLEVKAAGNKIETSAAGATSVAGVFAAGDAATGPDSVIGAVASGYQAAAAADRRIAGGGAFLVPDPELVNADKELVLLRNRQVKRRGRVEVNERAAAERKRDSEPYVNVMSEAEAVAEATRCLRCGCSVTCGLCQRICSSFAISLESDQYQIDKAECHACGMCVQLCPNNNMEIVAE